MRSISNGHSLLSCHPKGASGIADMSMHTRVLPLVQWSVFLGWTLQEKDALYLPAEIRPDAWALNFPKSDLKISSADMKRFCMCSVLCV